MKIVIDTNNIVSALLTPNGLSAKLLDLVFEKKLVLVYDNFILTEYFNILHREKFKLDKKLVNTVINFVIKNGEYKLAEFQKIEFNDKNDKMFYEVYKNEDVDFLITGNIKHFPKEKNIVTVREFLDIYEAK